MRAAPNVIKGGKSGNELYILRGESSSPSGGGRKNPIGKECEGLAFKTGRYFKGKELKRGGGTPCLLGEGNTEEAFML